LSLGSVALAGIGADQLTKSIVTSRLDLNDQVHVVGAFSIHHVTNSGIAFGLFASATSLVILLTGLAVAWMLYFFARSGSRHPVLPVALGLVIGGSVSNLTDRVRLGHVTDFLDFKVLAGLQPRRHIHRRRRSGSAAGARGLGPTVVPAPARGVKQRVPDEAAGERLDRFLASLPQIGSRGHGGTAGSRRHGARRRSACSVRASDSPAAKRSSSNRRSKSPPSSSRNRSTCASPTRTNT